MWSEIIKRKLERLVRKNRNNRLKEEYEEFTITKAHKAKLERKECGTRKGPIRVSESTRVLVVTRPLWVQTQRSTLEEGSKS